MEKLNLFQIQQNLIELESRIYENDGEVSPADAILLDIAQSDLESKGRSYGYLIKKIDADVLSIDNEIARLTALKKPRVNLQARLKENISNAMALFGVDKIESPTLKLSFRKSKSVNVADLEALDQKYVTVKVTKSADKKAIKEAIESGEEVKGAYIEENFNLQIK